MAAIDDFLRALSGQESGGESDPYGASNRGGSGAYGKYQFMPQYWPEFAQQAGLPANAPMTPENQERVARARVSMLYNQYGNWADVAAVWYSGRPLTGMSEATANASQSGGPSIRQYANEVVGRMGGGSAPVNGRAPTVALTWANAPITGKFGPTDEVRDGGYTDPVTGEYFPHFNKGYDFGIPAGTPIEAAVGGEVIAVGRQGDGWGISVKIRDAEGNTHNYGHLSDFSVQVGDRVAAGQLIGISGNSADPIPGTDMVTSTGDHLSYDVWDANGRYLDPSRFLNGGSVGPELPFSQQEYQQKVARYLYLESKLNNYDPYDQESYDGDYDADLQEWSQVAAEIQAYDTALARGGTGIDDEIARGRYQWETDPRRIDAENSANAWARQQQINQQALTSTQNDLAEQRLTQDSANAETQAYKQSSIFGAPMGFRVGATDLPTEEELFQKNIDRVSKNLPEVTPIPYAPPLGAFGAPRSPSGSSTGPLSQTPAANSALLAPLAGILNPAAPKPSWAPQDLQQPNASLTSPGLGGRIDSAFGNTSLGRLGGLFGGQQQAPAPTAPGDQSAFGRRFQFPNPLAGAMIDATAPRQPQSSIATSARRFVGSLFNGRRY